MKVQLPTIYPITDRRISGLSVPEQVRRLIDGGAKLIQVRDKDASSRELFEAAESSLLIARPEGVQVIINDRVDIAMILKADGVHLGQQDLHPEIARKLLGSDAIIGYSTHNIDQARAAADMPIDYIAFGPIFPTSTKVDYDPVVGLELLAKVREIVCHLPLVAIGGITADNIDAVLRSGADTAAIISAILSPPHQISDNVRKFLAASLPR